MVKASSLYSLIEAAHAPPEWACFPEVANGTGSVARRWADAIAMSLWPSRGLIVRGFEIKVTRGDFKREAADPEKAETIARFCDEWWIVTPVGLVCDVETELPPAWGLMEADKGAKKLRTRRKAERTAAAELSRAFLAAVLRRAQQQVAGVLEGYVRREDIDEQLKAAEDRGRASVPMALRSVQGELKRARDAIAGFAKETGIDLLEGGWNDRGEQLGRAVKVGLALLGRYGERLPSFDRALGGFENTVRKMREDLKEAVEAKPDHYFDRGAGAAILGVGDIDSVEEP